VTDLEAKVLEFLKEEQITKEELGSRGEHREMCLEIKPGLENLFGVSANKMSQLKRRMQRLKSGIMMNYDEDFPKLVRQSGQPGC
jgi:hypothetical protein